MCNIKEKEGGEKTFDVWIKKKQFLYKVNIIDFDISQL